MTVWVRQNLTSMRSRSKLLLGLFLLLAAGALFQFLSLSPVYAQATPSTTKTINFSARLKNASGVVAPDGYYNVRFKLYTVNQSGSPIWTETHFDQNGTASGEDYRIKVTNGYLSAKLGSRTAFDTNVNWNNGLWLTMEIGGQTQSSNLSTIPWDGEMSPRIELNAVPYAMNAGMLGGKSAGDFIQLGQGTQTNASDNPAISLNTTGNGSLIQLQRDAKNVFTVDNAGNISFGGGDDHRIAIDQSGEGTDGRTLTISGGDGGSGTTNGGNLVLKGGDGSGDGAQGLVVLTTATFATATDDSNCYAGGKIVNASCTVTQSTVDTSSAVILGFSAADQTATLPDPTLATPGRILYVMAANDSLPFSLKINSNEVIALKAKNALTMLWNGNDWVVAGQTGAVGGTQPQAPQITDEEPIIPPVVVDDTASDETLAIEGVDADTPPAPEATTSAPSSGGLFQLSQLETAPPAAPGSMYYDATLGKVQCYEANGWGSCGDAPDTFVAISPEYKNAVMNGTDIGIISSDFCSGSLGINDGSKSQLAVCNNNETFNFYRWTTEETNDQTRSIYLTYQLPENFKSFVAGSASIMGRTDSGDSAVSYQVYRDNGTGLISCGTPIDVSSGVKASWQRGLALDSSDPASCGFEAGDSILFRINLTAKNKANAYVSNVNFIFRNS